VAERLDRDSLSNQISVAGRQKIRIGEMGLMQLLNSKTFLNLSFLLSVLAVAGCSKDPSASSAPATSPPQVEVVEVEQKDVPIYREWIATLDGMDNAEIKAQVTGYLIAKRYIEGSLVQKGQLLFEIDSRPLQAAVDQAKGALAQANSQLLEAKAQVLVAEANQGKTELDAKRFTTLFESQSGSKQDADNAVQANLAAKAEVEASKAKVESAKAAIEAATAALTTAELNLSFTEIVSPIEGVAGIARAQIGNLVGPTTDILTTVSTLDPIKAYFTASEQEYLKYIRTHPDETLRKTHEQEIELELILADDSVYPQKGKFFVGDREVNAQTGTLRFVGLFANPENILRPGQYGRIRAVTETKPAALLVPQRSVTEVQGAYHVAVVDAQNKVSIRNVKVGERFGSMWIIEEGLTQGEKVVAEGTQKVTPGLEVIPKPYVSNSKESAEEPQANR